MFSLVFQKNQDSFGGNSKSKSSFGEISSASEILKIWLGGTSGGGTGGTGGSNTGGNNGGNPGGDGGGGGGNGPITSWPAGINFPNNNTGGTTTTIPIAPPGASAPFYTFLEQCGTEPPIGSLCQIIRMLRFSMLQPKLTTETLEMCWSNPAFLAVVLEHFQKDPADGSNFGRANLLANSINTGKISVNTGIELLDITNTIEYHATNLQWVIDNNNKQYPEILIEAYNDLGNSPNVSWEGIFDALMCIDNGLTEGLYSVEELEMIEALNLGAIFAADFVVNLALVIQADYPGLSYDDLSASQKTKAFAKAFWRTSSGYVHTTLDICGLIPAVGEPCDFVNGVIYTIEGEGANAALSFAATIPIVGWAATATKAARVINVGGKAVHLAFTKTGNLIEFGNRIQLRQVLGLVPNDLLQAHHIVPWALSGENLVQRAAANKFHMNLPENGIVLTATHLGGTHAFHPNYNIRVVADMTARWNTLVTQFGSAQAITADAAKAEINAMNNKIRTAIANNPSIKIDLLTW